MNADIRGFFSGILSPNMSLGEKTVQSKREHPSGNKTGEDLKRMRPSCIEGTACSDAGGVNTSAPSSALPDIHSSPTPSKLFTRTLEADMGNKNQEHLAQAPAAASIRDGAARSEEELQTLLHEQPRHVLERIILNHLRHPESVDIPSSEMARLVQSIEQARSDLQPDPPSDLEIKHWPTAVDVPDDEGGVEGFVSEVLFSAAVDQEGATASTPVGERVESTEGESTVGHAAVAGERMRATRTTRTTRTAATLPEGRLSFREDGTQKRLNTPATRIAQLTCELCVVIDLKREDQGTLFRVQSLLQAGADPSRPDPQARPFGASPVYIAASFLMVPTYPNRTHDISSHTVPPVPLLHPIPSHPIPPHPTPPHSIPPHPISSHPSLFHPSYSDSDASTAPAFLANRQTDASPHAWRDPPAQSLQG